MIFFATGLMNETPNVARELVTACHPVLTQPLAESYAEA